MKIKVVLCILVVIVFSLTGCNWFRQPDPGNQPNVPEQQRPSEPQLPPQSDLPNPDNNRTFQPTANDVTRRAKEVSGVDNAVAIVLGNMAMVGIEVQDGNNANQREDQVSEQIRASFSEIDTVYVTSEQELTDQISAVAERIGRGQPISELMDDIYDIWQRMQQQP